MTVEGWKSIGQCAGDLAASLGMFREELRTWLRQTGEVVSQFDYDFHDKNPDKDVVRRAFGMCSEHILKLGELQGKARALAEAFAIPDPKAVAKPEPVRTQLVPKAEYAKLLGVSVATVRRRIKAGELPFVTEANDKNYRVELDKDGQRRTA